jgi:hypothetical protein
MIEKGTFMQIWKPVRLASLLAVIVLMLAACGGGPTQGASDGQSAPSRSQASGPAMGSQEPVLSTTCQVQLPADGEGSAQA